MKCKSEKIELAFFQGLYFTNSIGATDWRIGLFFPDDVYEVTIYGKGKPSSTKIKNATLITKPYINVPILGPIVLSFLYALDASTRTIDVVICNHGVYPAAMFLKLINPKLKVILDIRSIPVEVHGFVKFYWDIYLFILLHWGFSTGMTIITRGMLIDIEKRYHFKNILPLAIWASAYDDDIFIPLSLNTINTFSSKVNGKFILMFHGSLSPTRGLDQVIRSIHQLKDKGFDDIRLVFIGTGKALRGLMRLAKLESVDDQVLFFPPIPHHELPKYLARADLGINPWPDHPWWRDQSPLKVFEYLSMGIPVLATDLPCHRGISDAVLIVPDNSPESIAEGIIRFRSLDERSRKMLSKIAVEDSKQHTWKARASLLARFIQEEIIKQKPVDNGFTD